MKRATEDYLKAIYRIREAGGEVTPGALAEGLAVAPASVTGMLKKLAAQDLIVYEPYRSVELTGAGEEIALRVLRYHRLAESYLAQVLGLSWDKLHGEAEQWEHVLSEEVIGRMSEAMGHPAVDPHGDPIPAPDGVMPPRDDRPLTSLAVGQGAVVSKVYSQEAVFLRYLGELGFFPGTEVVVLEVAPFQGPLTVAVAGRRQVVGRALADQVYVSSTREAAL